MSQDDAEVILHASTVSVEARALVITGKSGAGKSDLALQMIALGADLVADDRTRVVRHGGGPPIASAPEAITGMIEARYLGLLRVPPAPLAEVVALVDLDRPEPDRLPIRRTTDVLGTPLPLFLRSDMPGFAAALVLLLRHGLIQS